MNLWTKKGQEATTLSLGTIIQIALLVTVVVSFFFYIKRVEDNSVFEQSYASRDIALLLEATQGVQGDVVLYYSQPSFDVGKYSYSFTDNLLKIYEENPASALYYPFFVDTTPDFTNKLATFEHPAAFVISKEKNVLQVQRFGDIVIEKKNEIPCPSLASTNLEKLSLVVLSSDPLLEPIQKYFIENANVDFAKKSTIESSISETTNLVLILTLGDGTAVHAFIPTQNSVQSEKLGCLMTNSLGQQYPDAILDTVTISDTALLNMNKGQLAVELIIGKDLLTDPALVSSALRTALEDYYEE